ncbi:hypothetical protein LTR56_020067 [Elasticomyces elasticus]|nr:hypothetical protein LTR56_020067 [Elasticomyces elasticus]KAK3636224.1 hypothetical protein LTR22_018829 [Elasticomyces elasticus]KAK4918347.1 hypothetical protein LTR49_013897 [Elasticomyces elasticus]KAK5762703.1 hypothetical protein LTS12_007092 [Elasticomyces elasticus]
MTFKIFLTGGSGYVGGSVLHTIARAHPEYEISVLLRRVPEAFSSTYPDVKIIKGNYDDFSTIAAGAEAANLVIHNGDSDHEGSLNAIITGLLRRSDAGYLIHLSGSGIVADGNDGRYHGKLNPKIWSDLTSLEEIRSLPADTLHQNTETIIHNAIRDYPGKINIAIMCPPDIYGKGKGLVKTHSVFVPMLVQGIKALGGKVFFYGEGTNTRSWVSMDDLMVLYLKVVQASASGDVAGYFNNSGYFFAGTQEHSHLDIVTVTGKILHQQGVVSDPKPIQISLEELDACVTIPGYEDMKVGRYLFASNSRTRAERSGKLFGYKGQSPGLLESLEAEILASI